MSTSTLDQRLTSVRRRVRQVLLTYGASWLAAVLVGSVMLACFGDWLIHFDDPIVRLIFGLGIVAGTAWAIRLHLLGPLKVALSDVDLALRIEDRYPGFQDSLASSVQFVRSSADPRLGSPALQQIVVERTLDRLDGLDCSDVIDVREVRRIAAVALAVCLTGALLAGLHRTQTSIALRRLVFPFSAPAWPKQTNLRLLTSELVPLEFNPQEPLHIARGDTLKLLAENTSGRLPSRVALEYRLADRKVVSEVMRPTTINDARGQRREVAVGQLLAVKSEVEFRAVGGDDEQMSWFRLVAVPPPVVEKLQVTLTPPAYTRREPERLPEGVGHVQGLVGTRVEIAALASKAVKGATLRVKDQERRRAQLGADGRELRASFVISDAGIHSWWLELKDIQGFEDSEPTRYEVRGVQDFEPEIYIDLPASDMQVTPDAVVRVRTSAKDDLGLKKMFLLYKVETAPVGEPEGLIPLFSGAERPLSHTAEHMWKIADLHPAPGARIVFHAEATDDFDLSAEFPAGKAPPPHIGRSVMRTLTIISREDKAQEIAQRQEGLLDDLERAFKLQQQAHDQVDDLVVQLKNADKFRPEDLDTLKRTELGQRDVTSQLTNPATGLEKRVRDLFEELRNNQINDPETERRLKRIADELDRIGQDHLQPIEEDLTQARKLLQSSHSGAKSSSNVPQSADGKTKPGSDKTPSSEGNKDPQVGARNGQKAPTGASKGVKPEGDNTRKPGDGTGKTDPESKTGSKSEAPSSSPKAKSAAKSESAADKPAGRSKKTGKPDPRPEGALRQVAANQAAVLESLGEMLQDLSQWRGEHDAARELSDLVRAQLELNQRALELAKETLTKPAESLSPQEHADLAKLAERQKKQAEQLEQLEAKMQGTVENLADENPAAAAALKDAVEQSRQEAIAGSMRDAAGQIGENRMGQAARSQQEILQKLRDLENTLRHNRESDTEMLVKKLKQAEGELQQLHDRQAELIKKQKEAEKTADPDERRQELEQLRKEQQTLKEDTLRMARRLARLEARSSQASSERAASRMQEAQESLEEGDQSSAARQEQEALDDLEQAQRELARARRAEEEHLAREQLARVADELAGMSARQKAANDETRRLDKLHSEAGKWSRGQLVSLNDLARIQRTLSDETERIAEKLAGADVFAQALKGAVRNMGFSAEQLAQRNTGLPTQKAQEAASQRLSDLVESLKQDEPDGQEQQAQDQQEGGSGGDQGNPPTDGIPTLAQVKMLIALQRELFGRTAELEKLRGKDGRLPPAAQSELELLAREQGELADLVRNLSAIASSADADSEDDRKPNDEENQKSE